MKTLETNARVWLAALAVACGGPAGPSTATPAAPQGEEPFEETGSMQALAPGQEAPALPTREIGQVVDQRGAMELLALRSAGAPPADTRELYRRLAPATVIVRSQDTMGTGVVVGPNGLVLTNHHVIRSAELDDFRLRVTVEYGQVGPNGSMVPDGNPRPAYVLRLDRDRDLAVLRVQEPAETPIVALAADDPSPGSTVTTIGHGNVGLVWAVRRCEVEATGRLEETYSRLAAICGGGNEANQEACRHLRERMHRDMNGLVVQSSCPLTPGDSGGPLVDTSGNLVGLNVMTIRNTNNQWSNFHIHARELRDFLRSVPERPLRSVPSPWIEPEGGVVQQDQDLDGRWDTLAFTGAEGVTVRLIDLDQDTPDVGPRSTAEGFDAEVAIVTRYPERFVWYDRDGDGSLELVVSASPDQQLRAAHRVVGETVERVELPAGPALSADRVPQAARGRFAAIFDESHLAAHPSPMPAVLRRGVPLDGDRDGTVDTIDAHQAMVRALVFDVDQSSLSGLGVDQVDAYVREGRVDAEVSLVLRDPILWAYYDRDGDGRFETGLRTAPDSPVVAAVVPGEGAPSADDLVGTLAVRADWLGARHDAFVRMTERRVARSYLATNSDLGGLPDPVRHHDGPSVRASYTENGWENYVVKLTGTQFVSSLVDVDRSSFRGAQGRRRLAAGLDAVIRERQFSTDFAVISTRGGFWAFYDTNFDGTWDIALVHVVDGDRAVRNAFRRNREGVFVHDPALVEGRIVRPSLIPTRHRRAFEQFARAYFLDWLVEPASR